MGRLITSIVNQVSVEEVAGQIQENLSFIYTPLPESYAAYLKYYKHSIVETMFCSRGFNQTYEVFSNFDVEKFDPGCFRFNLRRIGVGKWLIVLPPIDVLDGQVFCTPIVILEADVRRMFRTVFCDPSMTAYKITR
jgi:hypothetical protein